MPTGRAARNLRPMYHDMNGWAWLSMSFGFLFWVLTIAGAVYVGVRFAVHRTRARRDALHRDVPSDSQYPHGV